MRKNNQNEKRSIGCGRSFYTRSKSQEIGNVEVFTFSGLVRKRNGFGFFVRQARFACVSCGFSRFSLRVPIFEIIDRISWRRNRRKRMGGVKIALFAPRAG